jgi:Ohr subfamily peroxiredoxin
MSNKLEQTLYTAHTNTTGGRTGRGRSNDGAIDVQLSMPGTNAPGTNPEQLFGIGWSACFLSAMGFAGQAIGVKLPADASIDAAVSLGKLNNGETYSLAAKLKVYLPGLAADVKKQIVDKAHETCPYSRVTRGNIDVEFEIA